MHRLTVVLKCPANDMSRHFPIKVQCQRALQEKQCGMFYKNHFTLNEYRYLTDDAGNCCFFGRLKAIHREYENGQ